MEKKRTNVIDMTSRMKTPDFSERLKNLKVRLDLEHARVAVPASLLSIVLLVTLANATMMNTPKATDLASVDAEVSGRAIASVSTGTSIAEDQLVRRLAKGALSDTASVGRKPSSLENLTLGLLEGKYAVRMQDGRLRELEFTITPSDQDRPKHIEDREAFLKAHADLLALEFDKTIKVEQSKEGGSTLETYHLVNGLSIPVAKVQFRLDSVGRMLSMRVSQVQVAAK
jgi:hypothetical protein